MLDRFKGDGVDVVQVCIRLRIHREIAAAELQAMEYRELDPAAVKPAQPAAAALELVSRRGLDNLTLPLGVFLLSTLLMLKTRG